MSKQKITKEEFEKLSKIMDPIEVVRKYEIVKTLNEVVAQEKAVKKIDDQGDYSHVKRFGEAPEKTIKKEVVIKPRKLSDNKFPGQKTKNGVLLIFGFIAVVIGIVAVNSISNQSQESKKERLGLIEHDVKLYNNFLERLVALSNKLVDASTKTDLDLGSESASNLNTLINEYETGALAKLKFTNPEGAEEKKVFDYIKRVGDQLAKDVPILKKYSKWSVCGFEEAQVIETIKTKFTNLPKPNNIEEAYEYNKNAKNLLIEVVKFYKIAASCSEIIEPGGKFALETPAKVDSIVSKLRTVDLNPDNYADEVAKTGLTELLKTAPKRNPWTLIGDDLENAFAKMNESVDKINK